MNIVIIYLYHHWETALHSVRVLEHVISENLGFCTFYYMKDSVVDFSHNNVLFDAFSYSVYVLST